MSSISPHIFANALMDAADTNGYISKDGERAVRLTIESGLQAGMNYPRDPLNLPPHIEAIHLGWVARAIEVGKFKQPSSSAQLGKRTVTVLQGSAITERPVTWLWDG